MGGPVRITIRTPRGKVHKLNAWTGYIAELTEDDRFYNEDPVFIQDFVNLLTEEFSEGTLAPDGYGLVVADMVNKVILSSQDYTTPGQVFSSSIQISRQGRVIGEDEGYTRFDNFVTLFLNGRVPELDIHEEGASRTDDVRNITLAEFIDKYLDNFGHQGGFWFSNLDIHPYVVVEYRPYSMEILTMRDRVIELGFTLTPEEHREWDEFLEPYLEEETES